MRWWVMVCLSPLCLLVVSIKTGALEIPRHADTVTSDYELSTKDVGAKEVLLGDVVTDAMRLAMKADAAFIAATSFNDGVVIAKGSINTTDIQDALVYKNESVLVVKLTGAQITRAIEQSLFLYPKQNSAYLQFSGLTALIKPDGDTGKRVLSIKVAGVALDAAKLYRVAMPAPLANGGLAYFKIWQKTSVERETDATLAGALTRYFMDHKTIQKGEDRLVTRK